MATPNLVPRADSEGGIGTASKYWASAYIDLIYVGAGKMGRDADNLLDFSTDNQIKIRVNGTNEIFMNNARFAPSTNDGYILGGASNQWSDLFLASGAVINFDNGNVTLTHSSNSLTLGDNDVMKFGADGDLFVYHSGSNGAIDNYTGNLTITNNANDADLIFACDDGSGGTTAYFTLDGGLGYTLADKHIRFADNIEARFGTGSDFKISHDGSHVYLANSTGDFYLEQKTDDGDIIFTCDDGSGGTTAYLTLDGGLGYTTAQKRIRFQDSVNAEFGNSGDYIMYHDGSNMTMYNTLGNLNIYNAADNGAIQLFCDDGAGGNTVYFKLDGNSATHDGSATTALFTNWPDKSNISLGTSHDLRIYHDGSNSQIFNYTGNLEIKNHSDDADIIFQCDDGSGGVTAYLTLDGSAGFTTVQKLIKFEDNVHARFGNGSDLRILHDGSNSEMNNHTGHLSFINYADDSDIIFKSDDGSGGVTAYLTLDGSAGRTNIHKDLQFTDSIKGKFGTSGDLEIYHDGSNSYIANKGSAGDLYISNDHEDKDVIFQCDDGSGGLATYLTLDGSAEKILMHKSTVFSGGGMDFGVDDTGADVIFYGATSGRNMKWDESEDHLLFTDNTKLKLGTGGDLQFYHDGSDSYVRAYNNDLIIMQDAADKDIIFKADNGSGGTAEYLRLDGGAAITIVSKEMRFGDSVPLKLGAGPDFEMSHNGSNTLITNNTGNLLFTQNTDDGNILFYNDDGSGGATVYLTLDGGDVSTIVSTIKVMMPNLPTSDPSVAGQLWNSSGDLKISAG